MTNKISIDRELLEDIKDCLDCLIEKEWFDEEESSAPELSEQILELLGARI